MSKIDFGNYLYGLRKNCGLTQRYVAYELKVSNKAVSKWENGYATPSLDKLKSLATLYNVEMINDSLDTLAIEELLSYKQAHESLKDDSSNPFGFKTLSLFTSFDSILYMNFFLTNYPNSYLYMKLQHIKFLHLFLFFLHQG